MTVKTQAEICPKCSSLEVVYTGLEFDVGGVCISFRCSECGRTWKEYYKLEYDGYYDGDCIRDRFDNKEE